MPKTPEETQATADAPAMPPGLKLRRTLEGHAGSVTSLAFDSQGRMLASGSRDGTLRLWDPQSGNWLRTLAGHTGAVFGVALDSHDSVLATGGDDQTTRLWDPQTGTLSRTLKGQRM